MNRGVSRCALLEVIGTRKLGAVDWRWGIHVIGWACLFGFLQLVLSWKWGRKLGKLSVFNQVPAILS